MKPYVVLEKVVGQTPLQCAEEWRARYSVDASVPLAYAGRLDPMASGKLLVLIGDECKRQTDYHDLDKAYDFSVLLGIGSDTHDVLGRLAVNSSEFIKMHSPNPSAKRAFLGTLMSESRLTDSVDIDVQTSNLAQITPGKRAARDIKGNASQSSSELVRQLELIAQDLIGEIELPYPHFSAKTVQGKPLHMWTLEGRLDGINIPTKRSTIYDLQLTGIETCARQDLAQQARAKIDTIPPVTEERKALGNDFRRTDVRADWERIKNDDALSREYTIAYFHCVCSSGTYMRTLAKIIGKKLHTQGLAWHIHRTDIGMYDPDIQAWRIAF